MGKRRKGDEKRFPVRNLCTCLVYTAKPLYVSYLSSILFMSHKRTYEHSSCYYSNETGNFENTKTHP